MFGYRKKLERDLDHWRDKGWVDGDGVRAILKDVDSRGIGLGLAPILGILAAILLSFAAMTFVAANWQEMSKLARLALLFIALGGSNASAWAFKERNMPFFSEAAILLGTGIFGASIMLIAQMYHMEGNPPDAVLLWAVGSLLATILLNSRATLALSIILFTLWSVWQGEINREIHWPYLIVWAGMLYITLRRNWRPALHMLAVAFIVWAITQMLVIQLGDTFKIITALGLGVTAIAYLAQDWIDQHSRFAAPLMKYGLVTAFIGSYFWQFIDNSKNAELLFLAIATLAAIIAVIFYASRITDNKMLWLGYGGFSIELLSLYFKTLGTLLDTSLFFLVAGLIVSALAYFALRLHQHQQAVNDGEAEL